MPHVLSAVNIYSKLVKIAHIQVRSFVSKPYFSHKVSVHFYSLAPTRNKCVYAQSVVFLVLLV
jgi:hypothetical protein